MPKDFRPIQKAAKKQGWTVRYTGTGHYRWTAPDGQCVVSGSTPSDYHAFKNFVSSLKRKGLKL